MSKKKDKKEKKDKKQKKGFSPKDLLKTSKKEEVKETSSTAKAKVEEKTTEAKPAKAPVLKIAEKRAAKQGATKEQGKEAKKSAGKKGAGELRHPGAILSDYMLVHGLTVAKTAELLYSSRQSVNELAHERRACSADMALKLAKLFGTDAKFWLNMQRDVDLAEAEKKCAKEIAEIKPL